ncbi:RNA helicase, partial [Streptomyces sp. NPDC047980]
VNRDRRDDRPSGGGFRRDNDRRDDRGGRSFERRDHRAGSDRPFNRDRRDDRPSGGGFRSGHDRPFGRRDDHRGGSNSGSFGGGRRDDKPRWKRNG